jgi:hypothetical protein
MRMIVSDRDPETVIPRKASPAGAAGHAASANLPERSATCAFDQNDLHVVSWLVISDVSLAIKRCHSQEIKRCLSG